MTYWLCFKLELLLNVLCCGSSFVDTAAKETELFHQQKRKDFRKMFLVFAHVQLELTEQVTSTDKLDSSLVNGLIMLQSLSKWENIKDTLQTL
jgi:hypothetical protein